MKKIFDTPEEMLLYISLRSFFGVTRIENPGLPDFKSINWDTLFWLANRHRVLPILYQFLNHHNADNVPPVYLSQLRDNYQVNGIRAFQRYKEINEILQHLLDKQITAVPTWGGILAERSYGDLALRSLSFRSALTFLVKARDITRAWDVLAPIGYHFEPRMREHGNSCLKLICIFG